MKCAICGNEIKGLGHNPRPLCEKGKCCDRCNIKVIVARIKKARKTK